MDSFYGKLFRESVAAGATAQGALQDIEEAGYFEESFPEPIDSVAACRWWPLPVSKVRRNLAGIEGGPPVVLLATGALAPVHEGHLRMMESARDELIRRGYAVVGGYLSPGHDEYMRYKGVPLGASEKFPRGLRAPVRVAAVARAAGSSDWLDVSNFEALGCPGSVNFTTVYAYVRAALDRQIGPGVIRVFVVFGSDNERLALVPDIPFVIVERPDALPNPRYAGTSYRERLLADGGRVVFAGSSGDPSSSSTIRAAQAPHDLLPARVGEYLSCPPPEVATTRIHGAGALPRWGAAEHRVVDLLGDFFSEQVVADAFEQGRSILNELGNAALVSLDPLIEAQYGLRISRCYDFGGYARSVRPSEVPGFASPPGFQDLLGQVDAIPSGLPLVLVDDDSVTGSTFRAVSALLESRGRTVAATCYLTCGGDREVLDARDFILGAPHGGLVVDAGHHGVVRLPYAYPFVDPTERASIDPARALEFSRRAWELSASAYPGDDTLADLPHGLGTFLSNQLDCAMGTPVRELCLSVARMLSAL